jgi:F-type H+-transporting ATPase subunit O
LTAFRDLWEKNPLCENMSSSKVAAAAAMTTATRRIPLTLHGIDGRYATALYSASMAQKSTTQAQTDLHAVMSALKRDTRASSVLMMPIFSRAVKQNRINVLVEQVLSFN